MSPTPGVDLAQTNARAESASPTASATSAGPATTCRLPVVMPNPTGPPISGAFLSYPDDQIGPAQAQVTELDLQTGRSRTTAQPYLYGELSGISYDAALKRWLPVARAQVAADGVSYVYTEAGAPGEPNRIHLVDVASARDRVVYSGPYHAIGVTATGIYLNLLVQGGPEDGLWLLHPDSGQVEQLSSTHIWLTVNGGAAWAGDKDPSMQNPPDGPVFDEILRYDPLHRSIETWYESNSPLSLVGFDDQGAAIVELQNPSSVILLRTWGPTTSAQKLYISGGSNSVAASQFTDALGDPTGIWIGSEKGIYRWTNSGAGMQLASVAASNPAGPCT